MSAPDLELVHVVDHLQAGAQSALGENFVGAYQVGSLSRRLSNPGQPAYQPA